MQYEITVSELKQVLDQNNGIYLLDVRTPEEHQSFNIGGNLIPMNELPYRMAEIPQDKPIVVYCRSGVRSHSVVSFLLQQGFSNVKNLIGGVLAWAQA